MRLRGSAAARWRERCIPAAEAAALVPPGANVFVASACATPRLLLAALEDTAVEHPGMHLLHYLTDDDGGGHGRERSALRHRAFYLGRDMAELIPTGRADYVPIPASDLPHLMRAGRVRVDVAIVQVSPPDALGRCSLGVSVDVTRTAVECADLVIAEINPAMPRTGPYSVVDIDRLDALVEAEPQVIEHVHPDVGPVAEQIARYVARLVDDGSTLQVGLGRVPTQVLRYLGSRRDLGIHSDVITDTLVDLVESGVVTGRRKSMSQRKIVASLAIGTRRLYDLIDDNPDVVLRPLEDVCDPDVVARQTRMVSITHAYAVDLTGQVSAEGHGSMAYGGVGTQPLFHSGATRSPGGRAVVCLPSTERSGESTIRPDLGPAEAATIPRWEVRWVVTEWGAAYLYGASLRERAVSLIEVAHPDHREPLLAEARRRGLVPSDQRLRTGGAYPVEEEHQVRLGDGRTVLLRPTRTADAPLLQDLFYRLRPEDVLTRFFRRLSSLTLQMAEHLCSVSYEDEMAFAAVVGDSEREQVVGTSSYFRDPETGLADVAYMVDPAWQGLGLGTALHARTMDYARRHGVRGFTADVIAGNDPMLAIFRASPGWLGATEDDDVYEVELRFDQPDDPVVRPRPNGT